jgi:hypothetical protein
VHERKVVVLTERGTAALHLVPVRKLQSRDERIPVIDIGAAAAQATDDLEGRRPAQVGQARLVGDADDDHSGAGDAVAVPGQNFREPLDDPSGPGRDARHSLLDERCGHPAGAQLP